MFIRSILQLSLSALLTLGIVSCSKTPGGMGAGSEGGLSSKGLGSLSQRFQGQEPGESYTTEAPHNQVYLFAYDDSTINPK